MQKESCSCKKYGLRCSQIYLSCHGETCTNIEENVIEDVADIIMVKQLILDQELIFEIELLQMSMENK